VHYGRLEGPREAKFEALRTIRRFADVPWQQCFSGWTQPFLPESEADFFSWPLLPDLFPWQHSGVQFKRTWPIAPDREILDERWKALISARASLFRESRDRKMNRSYPSLLNGDRLPAVDGLPGDAPAPAPTRYGYRTLDRQYCLPDNRLGDFLRPTLWRTLSARQLFMTSLLTDILGSGPAVTVTHLPPDLHHFSGRGGKDIVPLWRDAEARKPNIAAGLLENLPKRLARMSTLKNSSPTATHSSPRRDTSSASPRSSKYRARVCR